MNKRRGICLIALLSPSQAAIKIKLGAEIRSSGEADAATTVKGWRALTPQPEEEKSKSKILEKKSYSGPSEAIESRGTGKYHLKFWFSIKQRADMRVNVILCLALLGVAMLEKVEAIDSIDFEKNHFGCGFYHFARGDFDAETCLSSW